LSSYSCPLCITSDSSASRTLNCAPSPSSPLLYCVRACRHFSKNRVNPPLDAYFGSRVFPPSTPSIRRVFPLLRLALSVRRWRHVSLGLFSRLTTMPFSQGLLSVFPLVFLNRLFNSHQQFSCRSNCNLAFFSSPYVLPPSSGSDVLSQLEDSPRYDGWFSLEGWLQMRARARPRISLHSFPLALLPAELLVRLLPDTSRPLKFGRNPPLNLTCPLSLFGFDW